VKKKKYTYINSDFLSYYYKINFLFRKKRNSLQFEKIFEKHFKHICVFVKQYYMQPNLNRPNLFKINLEMTIESEYFRCSIHNFCFFIDFFT
jgi:hypothetical protein